MIVIVGLGSPHGDDQIGWVAIDRLRSCPVPGISTHKVRGGIDLLECLDGQETGILIDAAAPAGHPGTIRSFVWPCPELAAVLPWSTHGLGLVEALQLGESLGRNPIKIFIYTIESSDISPGAPLSLEVASQLDGVLEAVLGHAANGGSEP